MRRHRRRRYRLSCPYCGNLAKVKSSKEFYGKDFKTYVYVCEDCDAYVTTHKNSRQPLGTMANSELRALRIRCHDYFDPFWKNGTVSRDEAYEWLSIVMGLPKHKAHIGMFNENQCHKLIRLLKKGKRALEANRRK